MVLLESSLLVMGTEMPNFSLLDPYHNAHSRSDLMGEKGLLILFTCNHCPYAIAVWKRLINLSKFAKEKGIETVAINPNINPEYPDDSPEKMKKKIDEWNIPFPYLVDEKQETAKL